jgi:hypothetical protein
MGLQENALTLTSPPVAGHSTVAGPVAWYPRGQVSVHDDPAWRPAHAVALTRGLTLDSVHVAAALCSVRI